MRFKKGRGLKRLSQKGEGVASLLIYLYLEALQHVIGSSKPMPIMRN